METEANTVTTRPPVSPGGTTVTPETVSRTRNSRPDRLRRRLSGDIDNIVLMAMRKEPHRRYTSAEELADDLRRHLDGLPVIARRDTAGYRTFKFVSRNRLAVAAAVLVVVSLVGGLGVAIDSWRDAETARAETAASRQQLQQMNTTLLEDLYAEIEHLRGSMKAREVIIDTAEDLTALLQAGDDSTAIQRDLASVTELRGDIAGSKEQHAEALQHYRDALAIRESQPSPHDPDLRAEIAANIRKIGHVQRRVETATDAMKSYERSLEIAKALAGSIDDRRQRELHHLALMGIGAAWNAQRKRAEALEVYLAARPLATRPVHVAACEYAIASKLEQLNDLEGALVRYMKARDIRRDLREQDPFNEKNRRDLANVELLIGQHLSDTSRHREALLYTAGAVEEYNAIVEDNPGNEADRRRLGLALTVHGDALLSLCRWDDAYDAYQSAHQELNRVPDAAARQRAHVAMAAVGLGHAAHARDDRDAARRHFTRALSIRTSLAESDTAYRTLRAQSLRNLGTLLIDQERLGEARSHLSEAQSIFEEAIRDGATPWRRTQLALTLRQLARLSLEDDDLDAALAHARRVIELDVDPTCTAWALHDEAVALQKRNERSAAVESAEQARALIADDDACGLEPLRTALAAIIDGGGE